MMRDLKAAVPLHFFKDALEGTNVSNQALDAASTDILLVGSVDPDCQVFEAVQVVEFVAEQKGQREGGCALKPDDAGVQGVVGQGVGIVDHTNLSVGDVTTPTVERSVVPSRLGSLAWDGGSTLCDDCAWQDCSSAGLCIRPFVSPVALLGLDVTPLEAVQILDEIAAAPPKLVFLGVDLGSPDLRAVAQLATVSLTGAGESPVVAAAMPAVPLRSGDGDLPSEFSTQGSPPAIERPAAEARTALALVGGGTPPSSAASPVHAGTQC